MVRRRLDIELVRRGLLDSRELARRFIVERRVLVDGAFALKPAYMVAPDQQITLARPPPRFVSRAGDKLHGALEEFSLPVAGRRCLDVGSSTGGFTDCLLQHGADSVVAVDVGTNQLHERIRNDPRVTVREQTDIRTVQPNDIDQLFELIVADVSFISLRLILPTMVALAAPHADFVVLIKPQFEAGRQEASRGRGVIADPEVWTRVLNEVVDTAEDHGLALRDLMPSPITGAGGNLEFVAWLAGSSPTIPDRDTCIAAAVARAGDPVRRNDR